MLNRLPAVAHRPPRGRRRLGLSIVELLVGVAIGMFVLAGASIVVSNQLSDNRHLLLETQVQQDMRAAMDMIVRDIRRSGYWVNAYRAVSPATSTAAASLTNPYTPVGVNQTEASDIVTYTYSRDRDVGRGAAAYDVLNDDENLGFRHNADAGTIEVQLGNNNWQALTDPQVLRVTQFQVVPGSTPLALPVCDSGSCPAETACGTRQIVARTVTVNITGEAVHDPSVRRQLTASARVRNDQVCL